MADPRQSHAPEENVRPADRPPYPGTPGWVKVIGIIAIVVVLLFVVLLVTRGPHGGLSRHFGDAGGRTPLARVIADHARAGGALGVLYPSILGLR